MSGVLASSEIFEGLGADVIATIETITSARTLAAGERVFSLGDDADRMYVVQRGCIDLCVPITILGEMRDVCIDTKGPASALGWSAFVKPYRYRMSARASEPTELVTIVRTELGALLADDPATKFRFMQRIAEITAQRMLRMQALWVRELQRSVPAQRLTLTDAD